MDKQATTHVNSDNPWPGLAPYTDRDGQWFRGRARELDEIARRVRQNTLTILFSRSGIGKTSLLRAGLLPRLRAKAYLPIYVRLDFSDNALSLVDQVWDMIDDQLALAPRYQSAPGVQRPSLWEFFHDQRTGILSPALAGISPIIIFDQFEEVFTLGERSEASQRDVLRLFDEIADLAENRTPAALQTRFDHDEGQIERFDFEAQPCHVLIALREDYLSHLERHRQRMPLLMQNRMPLSALNGSQALEAVLDPAPHLLDREVAERIVRFVGGSDTAELPSMAIDSSLLNLICRELNQTRLAQGQARLTTELLSGSREQILEHFYDGCFAKLNDGVRDFVERDLVTTSGYRESVSEERAIERIGQSALEDLVNKRLLSAEERGGVRRIELSHDLLTEVAARRREARMHREERAATERERQKQLRARRIAVLMGTLSVVAGLAAVFAFTKAREAKEARNDAREQSSGADFLLASEYQRTGRGALALAHLSRALRSNPHNVTAADTALGLLLNPSTDLGRLPEFSALDQDDVVRAVVWSPDHRSLLVISGNQSVIWHVPSPGEAGVPQKMASMPHEDEYHVPCIVRGGVWSPDGKQVVTWAADYRVRLFDSQGHSLHILGGHTDTVNSAVFSPDGHRVLTASYDHSARVWDTSSGAQLIALKGHSRCVNLAVFSPDGAIIATAADDASARLWDAKSGAQLGAPLTDDAPVESVEFGRSVREPRLLTISTVGARWWDPASMQPIGSVHSKVASARIGPDGHLLATATPAATVLANVFDTTKPPIVWAFEGRREAEGIAFSPEGRRLARYSDDKLRIWSTDTGEPMGKPFRLPCPIRSIDWSPDARRIAVASGTQVFIWDASEREPLIVTVPNDTAMSTPFQSSLVRNGELVGTVSDKQARIWSSKTGAPAGRPIVMTAGSTINGFSPDGRWFVAAFGKKVSRFDTVSGDQLGECSGHNDEIQALQFNGDGSRFVTASTDHSVIVWNTATGVLVSKFEHPSGQGIASASFNCDSTLLVIIGYDGKLYLADASTGAQRGEPMAHDERINSAEFSPDGRFIVSASDDRTVRVWETIRCRQVQCLSHLEPVYRASMSANNRLVATLIRGSKEIDVWDKDAGLKVGNALSHEKEIGAFAFNYSGTRIVTTSADFSAQVWDSATGEPIGGPFMHEKKVLGALFSPDGQQVLTACDDGRARLWETFSGVADAASSSGSEVPGWVPGFLDAVTSISVTDATLQDLERPSRQALRSRLDSLKVPWSHGVEGEGNNFLRVAAWLSLAPDDRPSSFSSRIPAEQERRSLLDSTSVAAVQRAFRMLPHSGVMQAALARFEPDVERGEFLLKRALALDATNPEAVFQAAQALEKRKAGSDDDRKANRERAISLLRGALKLHPKNAHCLRELGWLRSQEHDETEARQCFQQAMAITPTDPVLIEYYGWALLELGRSEEALTHWLKAEKTILPGTNISDMRAGLAIGLWRAGRKDEGLSVFARLRAEDPNRDWSQPETIKQLQGDWTEAEQSSLREMQAAAASIH